MTDIDFTTSEYQPVIVDGGRRHAVTDLDGLVTNVILWDGTTPYDPGDGYTLHPLPDDSPVGPGDTIDSRGDVVTKAPILPAEPTIEQRLDAIEAKTDKLPDSTAESAK